MITLRNIELDLPMACIEDLGFGADFIQFNDRLLRHGWLGEYGALGKFPDNSHKRAGDLIETPHGLYRVLYKTWVDGYPLIFGRDIKKLARDTYRVTRRAKMYREVARALPPRNALEYWRNPIIRVPDDPYKKIKDILFRYLEK